jgi:hypothetical protein
MDFEQASGDYSTAVHSTGRKLFSGANAFRNLGVHNGFGVAEYRPCDKSGTGCSPDDLPDATYRDVTLCQFDEDGLVWQVCEKDSHDYIWPVYLDVRISALNSSGVMTPLIQVYPGFGDPANSNEFFVYGRFGIISFGGARSDISELRIEIRNVIMNNKAALTIPNFGTSVPDVNVIIDNNPSWNIVPPRDVHTTIGDWTRDLEQAGRNPIAGTQSTRRYGILYNDPDKYLDLVIIDPMYDVQGQWFLASSYGLLQEIPETARGTLQMMSNRGADITPLLSLYNPMVDNPETLFDPTICTDFAGAAHAAASVSDELLERYPGEEDDCRDDDVSECSWNRIWKRRLRVFNTGREDNFNGYDTKVYVLSAQFEPIR